jgi:parallel beta helix pectate lyase-like protein
MRSLVAVLAVILCALSARADTYYLDAHAKGPGFEGSQDKPWQTVEQMQTFLAAKEGHGSGDTVLIAPGEYGDFIDGAHANHKVTADIQRKVLSRTDWLVLKAQDAKPPPRFSYIQVYGRRDAYLEFNGLHAHSKPPHDRRSIVSIRIAGKVRIINCEVSATVDETRLPSGIQCGQGAKDIHIEGSRVHHTSVGMSIGAEKLIVRNNEVHHCASSGIQTHGGTGTLLESNYVHHQFPRIVRIRVYGEISGNFKKGDAIIQEDTGAKATVYIVRKDYLEVTPRNKIKYEFVEGKPARAVKGESRVGPLTQVRSADLSHGSGLSIRSLDLTARGNIIHNYGSSAGIFVYPIRKPYKNLLFENNLVFDSITRSVVLNDIAENVVFRNNTFSGAVHAYVHKEFDGSGFHFYNNISGGIVVWKSDELGRFNEGKNILQVVNTRKPYKRLTSIGPGSSSVVLGQDAAGKKRFEELFVDFAGKDFRLKEGCPAIDSADPKKTPATDLSGHERGEKPDAGCFELGTKDWRPGRFDGSAGYQRATRSRRSR